ncbi:hypothetical protein TrRE_jg2713 [Triparma retinervis]|uniref:Uncharacterized protein n=1 Tax=Triparma retinervis TaxID=2557542 RepID=A0A9W7A7X2_9STRA|nr:hypothetical protein TrRE_jg2713 [Triparma retinervis]
MVSKGVIVEVRGGEMLGLDDKRGWVLILRRCGFDSKLKRVCVVADGGGKKVVYGKGAPETTRGLHMSKGRRVLALESKDLGKAETLQSVQARAREELKGGLTFRGLVVLACPVKEGTREVIEELGGSGHTCVMITGDAALTATEVARKVGIVKVGADKVLELRGGTEGLKWVGEEGGVEIPRQEGDEVGIKKLSVDGYELYVKTNMYIFVH